MGSRWFAAGYVALLSIDCGSGENIQSGGAQGQQPPPISIAGRWGMFHFEDPVAVEIAQDGTKLSGLGCDADLPTSPHDPVYIASYCSSLTGAISEDNAWFEFYVPFGQVTYRAEAIASKDSMRMAGSFTDAAGQLFKSSWLRLTNDQRDLVRLDGVHDMLEGDYALSLIAAESPGSSYDPSKTYKLSYGPGFGIDGDLGAFYYTEITHNDMSAPLQIGPVPATGTVLPVRLELDHNGASVTRVTAVNAGGTVSAFTAVRTQ